MNNDTATLVARTDFDGPELRFDWPGLRIGIAEYDEGPTGCTVIRLPPGGAACAIDIRGGSPGTLGNYEWTHAICFAGGSLYGLEATCGVAAELLAARGYTVGWTDIELVAGAIIYDFGRRENSVYPDRELGRAALRAAARGHVPTRRARSGPLGDGRQDVRLRRRRAVRPGRRLPPGRRDEDRRLHRRERVRRRLRSRRHGRARAPRPRGRNPPPGSSKRSSGACRRACPGTRRSRPCSRIRGSIGGSYGSSLRRCTPRLARAIQPFHALVDGDVLYAVTTREVDNAALPATNLGVLASELAWDAVLASVPDD